jgi:hypothetical protein
VLEVYHLRSTGKDSHYEKLIASEAVPGIDLTLLSRCILITNHVEAIKTFQAGLPKV